MMKNFTANYENDDNNEGSSLTTINDQRVMSIFLQISYFRRRRAVVIWA